MPDFQAMKLKEIEVYLKNSPDLAPEMIAILEKDQRQGAQELLKRAVKRQLQNEREEQRLKNMLNEELRLWAQGAALIAGIDEAGRGPLAGPVVAAAVILHENTMIRGLNDSKQLSAAKREMLFDIIISEALSYGLGSATEAEIDDLNIHQASFLAMKRALDRLKVKPDYVLVDGFSIPGCTYQQEAIIRGDSLSMSIAAASVLAKVARDKMMLELAECFPRYGFEKNMGYGTSFHRQALREYGPCPAHRRSFTLG